MVWSTFSDTVNWRKVISKFNSLTIPKSLSLSLGDWVYVDQISDLLDQPTSSQWYYGFKCCSSKDCGIFPASCTEKPGDEDLPELCAEIMSFLPVAQDMFMIGDKRVFHKAIAYFQELAGCNGKMWQSFSQAQANAHKCEALNFLSLCERYVGFPLQVRLPNPLNCISVQLYEAFLKNDKESKQWELPKRDLFNVCIELGQCTSGTLTLFLASQSIRLPDPVSSSGSDQDSHTMILRTHLIEFLKGNDDGSILTSFPSSAFQFGSLCRISENAFIEGSHREQKTSVIFTELKPFSPSDIRLLLVILVDKAGSAASRSARNLPADNRSSVGENERIRKPWAVACIDITKDLLPTLLPIYTPRSLDRQSKISFVPASRTVALRSSAETCHLDVLTKLANETRSSIWDMLPSTNTPKPADIVSGVSVLPPSYPVSQMNINSTEVSESPDIEIKDVKTLDLQPYHLLRREHPDGIIARPYGITESNLTGAVRNDLFVTLKSASFDKTSNRKEYSVEVEVSLRDPHGQPLPWIESARDTQYVSSVSAPRGQPRWNELIRIAIPWSIDPSNDHFSQPENLLDGCTVAEDHIEPIISLSSSPRFSGDPSAFSQRFPMFAHLRFVVRRRYAMSESRDKVIGVAFLPLWSQDGQSFIKDSDYSLFIHKMDVPEISECSYMSKEAISFLGSDSINSSGSSGGNKGSGLGKNELGAVHGSMAASLLNSMANSFSGRSSKQPDILIVSTLLSSNQYTTDEHLAKILSWRENMEDVVFCLKLLITHAEKENELKKFRIQLIDCLLQILSTNDAADSRMHVLELHRLTVALLARLYRQMNNNAAASELMEKYLRSPIFVHSGLRLNYLQVIIDLLSRSVQSRANSAMSVSDGGLIDVSKICTAFSWAFKVIAESQELEIGKLTVASPGLLETTEKQFIDAVDKFFGVILEVAIRSSDQLLKSHIFKHISETIDPLARVYPKCSLAKHFECLLQCTIQCPCLPNHNILSGCLRSVLMEEAECRKILVSLIVNDLKTLFSTNIDITLQPCRSEPNSMMTYFCNILILFMRRLVETVMSSSDVTESDSGFTHPELHHQFVQQGLLRWVMKQYGRILISLQRAVGSVPGSRPASSELTPTAEQALLATQSPAKSLFLHLQPVLGCLASVFTSILQHLRSSDWEVLLTPQCQPRLNCSCATCVGIELTDTSDFLHELFFIFLLSHSWPSYPGLHGANRPFKYHNLPTHLVAPLIPESNREQPWVEMLALQSTVELKTMKVIFEVCIQPYFLCNNSSCAGKLDPSHQKSLHIAGLFQRCLGSFITTQPHLWLEELPTITMVATAPRLPNGCLGDLRVSAGRLLEQLWQAIGQSHQTLYMEYFIPTVMDASTEPVSELRKICVKMLVDILRVNPLAAEPFLIKDIDRVMNWALPEFSTELLSLLEAEVPDGAFGSLGRRLSIGLRRAGPVKLLPSNLAVTAEKSRTRILGDMIRQISYLREYSEVITRRSKLGGMLAINNLRIYYDSIKRKDMTIRYLFKLEELHEQSENDVERGNTLERISGQYSWSSNPVDISEVSDRYADLGNISSSTLKEALLLDSLKYLKAGGDWKRAIEVCDQLVAFYRDVTADLAKLSAILNEQSQLYTNFVNGEARNQCCYKYYALHFSTRQDSPGFIGSTVVYRTLNQLSEVKMTLCQQFPEYHVETNNPQPLTSVLTRVTDEVPTIRLVGNLQPISELPPNWASSEVAANLSPHIKAYYEWNQVRRFTRTYHFKPSKSADGKEMPVAEEVLYTLGEKLPNIVSFMPVEDIITRTLSKVELVVNLVQDMSRSLSSMIGEMTSSSNAHALLSNFIGRLSTSIHSPVSGGLTALLTNVNLVDDSVDERQSEQLSDAVFQLLEVQAEGLNFCRSLEASAEAGGQLSNLLPTMLQQYHSLMHEMSMKFGISVSQLQDRVRFESTELTSSSAPSSLYQADRVYRRATNHLSTSQAIRPRGGFQQDLRFLNGDSLHGSVSSPWEEPNKSTTLVAFLQTPPPIPKRPSDLPPPDGITGEENFPQFAHHRPPYPLPAEPDRILDGLALPDAAPPPLPKKPPKPPPRDAMYPVTS